MNWYSYINLKNQRLFNIENAILTVIGAEENANHVSKFRKNSVRLYANHQTLKKNVIVEKLLNSIFKLFLS